MLGQVKQASSTLAASAGCVVTHPHSGHATSVPVVYGHIS
jgi:hypothetical protein